MTTKTHVHHYTESGLSNVYILGLSFEDDKGDTYVKIPHMGCYINLLQEKIRLARGFTFCGRNV